MSFSKTKFVLVTSLCILFNSVMFAQKIQGIATYKSQKRIDIKLDSTIPDKMQQQMLDQIKKQFQKEYELTFTENETSYKEVSKLETPNPTGGMVMVMGSGGDDILYKNLKEKKFVNQLEFFGKQFLIQDTLEQPTWVFEKDTKYIGEYPCFKATYNKEVEEKQFQSETNKDTEETITTKTINIEAWYTPQIPVQSGPDKFGGLPGLILELNYDGTTILCSKIILQPKEGVTVKEPKKGDKVSQKEYEEIIEKKIKEMNDNYSTPSGRGEKNSFSIKIGG